MSPLASIKKTLKAFKAKAQNKLSIKAKAQAKLSDKAKANTTTPPPTDKRYIGGAKLTGTTPPPKGTRPLMSADGNYPVNAEGYRTSKFTECMVWEPQPRKFRIDSAVDLLESVVANAQETVEVASLDSAVRNECEMRRLAQEFWEFNENDSALDLSGEESFGMEMREGGRVWWM